MESRYAPRVLVIDDDEGVANVIWSVLEREGYRVTVADRMEQALIVLGQKGDRCDLVLTDIFMEGMGGIEGIRRIRAARPEVRIIAISGGWGAIDGATALRAAAEVGADDAICKPFRADELREKVARLLDAADSNRPPVPDDG